jgi:hypothetical protein
MVAFSTSSFFRLGKAEAAKRNRKTPGAKKVELPPAKTDGTVSIEKAIKNRRTIRSFASTQLTLKQLAQLFWAAQGITDERSYKRAAPSAGALYPMDIYGIMGVQCVEGIKAGVWHYQPRDHSPPFLNSCLKSWVALHYMV